MNIKNLWRTINLKPQTAKSHGRYLPFITNARLRNLCTRGERKALMSRWGHTMPYHTFPSLPFPSHPFGVRLGRETQVEWVSSVDPLCSYPPTYMLVRWLPMATNTIDPCLARIYFLGNHEWSPTLPLTSKCTFQSPDPTTGSMTCRVSILTKPKLGPLKTGWVATRVMSQSNWCPWSPHTLLLLPSEMEPTCGLQKERSGSAFTLKHVVAPIVTLWCWIWSPFCVLLAKSRAWEIFTWIL